MSKSMKLPSSAATRRLLQTNMRSSCEMWPLYRDRERWCGARLISRFRFVKLEVLVL